MTKSSQKTKNSTVASMISASRIGAVSFVVNNKAMMVKAVVLMACVGVFYYPDLSIVFSNALKFTTGNIANYTILIPFLSAFIIYRKRKMLLALASAGKTESYSYPGIKLDDIIGVTLCTLAIIAYISSSTTLYALEFHLLTLPMFLAGGTMLLFNLATLRHSIVAILLLLYLQPPPGELVSELAADLSWASAVLNHWLLSTFGMPIQLDPSFGAPALVIETKEGLKTPFFVGEPSSGVFSTISLSLFAIFVAYIIRGKIWKRALLFVAGFPLFFLLNTLRIGIVITLWYLWGQDVSETYHSVSGALMVVIGTISILFIGEKALKLNLGTVKSKPQKCIECQNSNMSSTMDDQFCKFCGRIIYPLKHRRYRGEVERIVLVVFISTIAISVTGLKVGSNDSSGYNLSKLNISEVEGPETTRYFFPALANWDQTYAYRDSKIESILNQDASLAFRLVPKNTTAIMAIIGENQGTISDKDISNAVIFSSIQISTGHHIWEDSLVTAPSRIGRPGATILESGDITITDDTKGRFLLFKRQGFQNTEAVIEWFERGPLNFGSHFENRNILISVWATTDSLSRHGLIADPEDSATIKQLYLSIAKPTAEYWKSQLDDVKGGEDLLNTYFKNNFYFISSLVVFVFVVFWVSYETKRQKLSERNYNLYKQLPAGDKAFMDSLIHSSDKYNESTGFNISERYRGNTGNGISSTEVIEKIQSSENLGLIKRQIQSDKDEPILVWKPRFRTGMNGRPFQLGTLLVKNLKSRRKEL